MDDILFFFREGLYEKIELPDKVWTSLQFVRKNICVRNREFYKGKNGDIRTSRLFDLRKVRISIPHFPVRPISSYISRLEVDTSRGKTTQTRHNLRTIDKRPETVDWLTLDSDT